MPDGFAVKWRGEVRVESVSPSKIGAKVNGIVVLGKMIVFNGATDNEVNEMFDRLGNHAQLVEVSISEVE